MFDSTHRHYGCYCKKSPKYHLELSFKQKSIHALSDNLRQTKLTLISLLMADTYIIQDWLGCTQPKIQRFSAQTQNQFSGSVRLGRLWLSFSSTIFNVSTMSYLLSKDGCPSSRINWLAHHRIPSRKQGEPWQKGLVLLHLSYQEKIFPGGRPQSHVDS